MTIIRFKVTGGGPFPMDMLRRDHCYPDDTGDALSIEDSLQPHQVIHEPRTITLVTHAYTPTWRPTAGRWESFGWAVTEILGVTPVQMA